MPSGLGSFGGWGGGVVARSSPFTFGWVRRLRSTVGLVDTTRLKRVGIATYFGVYALIAVGGWRTLVGLGQRLPASVRPPVLPALHVLLGLPRSLAWGFVSLAVALLTVAVVATGHLVRARRARPQSLDDIGGRSWRDRLSRGLLGVDRLRRNGDADGFDEPDDSLDVAVVDGALAPPPTPLSLPRSTEDYPSLSVTASLPYTAMLTLDDAVERTDAEILDDGDGAESAASSTAEEPSDDTRSDGGETNDDSAPDPNAPWPPEPEDGEFDENAPWPDEWIPGDDL